jgi:hypothetical protein
MYLYTNFRNICIIEPADYLMTGSCLTDNHDSVRLYFLVYVEHKNSIKVIPFCSCACMTKNLLLLCAKATKIRRKHSFSYHKLDTKCK